MSEEIEKAVDQIEDLMMYRGKGIEAGKLESILEDVYLYGFEKGYDEGYDACYWQQTLYPNKED